MPRALILADLHWDHWREARLDPFAGLPRDFWATLDLVILSGDITNKASVRWPQVFDWFAQRVEPARLHVFPGNHDPYNEKIDREDKLIALCAAAGVHYAQRETVICGGHRLLCCTLWTDMRLGGDYHGNAARAENVMNDYRLIRVARDGFRKLTPADTVALHRADLAWLEAALAAPFAGETIVVTHHAPIPPSPAQDMDAAYGSDLTQTMDRHQPAAWLFGHTHRAQTARIGWTQVRNVSLGYPGEWVGRTDQIAGHLAGLVLDL